MMTGQVVTLRPFDRRHLDITRVWVNDPELMRLLDRGRPVSDIEHEEWYTALHSRMDALYFAIEKNEDKKHVGNVWLWGIDLRHRRAEMRVLIGDRDSIGKGIGTEAIALACDYAFTRLNLHKVYAYVLATNERARKSFEKAGFVVEGVLKSDRWVDDRYVDLYLLARINPH